MQNSTKKKVALVCASKFSESKFRKIDASENFDLIIAVDGGYQSLDEAKIKTDVAIGDFDSLGFEPAGIHVIKFPKDKDETDLELALNYSIEKGFEKAFVFGALGKRIDHTLSSIRACAFANKSGLDVEIVSEGEHVVLLTGEDAWTCKTISAGTTISVIPILGKIEGLFLRGFKWEADDLKLEKFASLGQSNVSTGEPILIGLKNGTIAIVINCV